MSILHGIINQPHVLKLSEVMRKNRGEIRLVGGSVRDALLEKEIHDIDVATDLSPDQVIHILTKHNIKSLPTGIKHGTVTALIDNNTIEITTLRRDLKCDGRHAVTEFTTNWQEDAARRDFTFNALYSDMEGKIYDYFEGINHLKNREIIFVGDPDQRVCEDYLRILRAFRFHSQIGCKQLSNDILNICEKYASKIRILSGERISNEMFNLLRCKTAGKTLVLMSSCGVLFEVIPASLNLDIIQLVEFNCDDPLVNLAFILRTNKSQDICKILYERWRLSKRQYRKLFMLYNGEIDLRESKRNIRKLGKELYLGMLVIYFYEGKISNKELVLNRQMTIDWDMPKFPLTGNDLIKIGYKKNKNLSYTLKRIEEYWEEKNYLLGKDLLIKYALILSARK